MSKKQRMKNKLDKYIIPVLKIQPIRCARIMQDSTPEKDISGHSGGFKWDDDEIIIS